MRHLPDGVDGVTTPGRLLICDRDPKWSRAVEAFLARALNCNAYAERVMSHS